MQGGGTTLHTHNGTNDAGAERGRVRRIAACWPLVAAAGYQATASAGYRQGEICKLAPKSDGGQPRQGITPTGDRATT
jgi:hypothetical protein